MPFYIKVVILNRSYSTDTGPICKKNYNRSKAEIIRFLLNIVVFRLVKYLFNMICFIIQLLYKIAYI